MNLQNYMERAERLLAEWGEGATHPQPNRLDLAIIPSELRRAVSILVEARWGYLAAITGLDPGLESNSLWVLYHFAEGITVVTIRVTVPREAPAVPTIRDLIPLAGIYEQELSEVLGVSVTGAIAGGRLFLPDDWPDDVYPLRKDFQTQK